MKTLAELRNIKRKDFTAGDIINLIAMVDVKDHVAKAALKGVKSVMTSESDSLVDVLAEVTVHQYMAINKCFAQACQ